MTKKSRGLAGLVLITVLIGATYLVLHARHPDLVLIGVIDADDVVVTPRVQARVDSLLVDEGSRVEVGQLIARLESSELAAQAAAVAATASGALSQLDESRSSALQVTGSTNAALSAANAHLASARSALMQEQAQLAQDSAQWDRTQRLVASGGLAPADLDRATNTLHAQQAVVAARRDEVVAAQADVASAQSGTHAVDAARSAVATTEARVRGARADALAAATRLEYAELRSPVAGVVQILSAHRGELVGPGMPVAVIVDPAKLWVRVAAPETMAGGVAAGDSLTVRLPSGESIRGRVISKAVEADFATQRDVSAAKRDIRAVALRVAIPNPGGRLVPGMTAQVLLPTAR